MGIPYEKTKAAQAQKLYRMLELGPSFSDIAMVDFTTDEAESQYEIWAKSWILPELKELIPQLKKS